MRRWRRLAWLASPVTAAILLSSCSGPALHVEGHAVTTASLLPVTTSEPTVAVPATPTTSPSAISPGISPPTDVGLYPCTTSELWIRISDDLAAAMSNGALVTFTNTSNHACSITGYPSVRAVDSSGDVIASAIASPAGYLGGYMGSATELPVIQLSTGESASALVEGSDQGIGVDQSYSPCPKYEWLVVGAPGSSETVAISAWLPDEGMDLPGCVTPTVHPVLPGGDLTYG